MKKRVSSILRFLLGFTILFLLIRSVPFNEFREVVQGVSWTAIAFVFLTIVIIRVLMGLRWFSILIANNVKVRLIPILYANYVSGSFGMLTPGGIGGDVMRGYLAKRQNVGLDITARSIVLDRFLGIYTLVLLNGIGFLVLPLLSIDPVLPLWFWIGVFGFIIGLPLVLLFQKHLKGIIDSLLSRKEKLQKFWRSFSTRRESVKSLLFIFLISFGVQLFRCLLMYGLFRAFHVDIPVPYFLIFSPIVFLVTMLPISPGGLGVREGMTVFLFGTVGVDSTFCIAVGISFQLVQWLVAIPGAVAWMIHPVVKFEDEEQV